MHWETKARNVRVGSYTSDSVTIEGLTETERDKVLAAFGAGAYWVRSQNGNFETASMYKELAGPIEDKDLLPFWRKATPSEVESSLKLFELEEGVPHHQVPAFIIQHLCGHNYTAENYLFAAEILSSYGFTCIRSRRGNDARFYEMWYLPGVYAAKGALADQLKNHTESQAKIDALLSFVSSEVSFGTLDIVVQRLALTSPE